MKLLPPQYTVVTCTVDAAASEVGTIYQACGFDYVGTMHNGIRTQVHINGTVMNERQAGRLFGTQVRVRSPNLGSRLRRWRARGATFAFVALGRNARQTAPHRSPRAALPEAAVNKGARGVSPERT